MPDDKPQDNDFNEWCILELMGHRRLAGLVTEQEIAGSSFLRLDVHDSDGGVATQYYSAAAVYCITPTTEEIARALGERDKPRPVYRYELEPPAARPAPDDEDDDDGIPI